jgi:hypothetical protein
MELSREDAQKLDHEGELVGIYHAFHALNLASKRYDGTCSQDDFMRETPLLVAAFRAFFEAFTGSPIAEAPFVAWRNRRIREPVAAFDDKVLGKGDVAQAALWSKAGSSLERLDGAFTTFFDSPTPGAIAALQSCLRTMDSTIRALQRYPASWKPALFLLPTVERLEGAEANPLTEAERTRLMTSIGELRTEIEMAMG